jgi:hypothetical protein
MKFIETYYSSFTRRYTTCKPHKVKFLNYALKLTRQTKYLKPLRLSSTMNTRWSLSLFAGNYFIQFVEKREKTF